MTIAIAACAAVLLSALAAVIVAIAVTLAFALPYELAYPMMGIASLATCIVIPTCLVTNLVCVAASRKDLPIHVATVAIAILLGLLLMATYPNLYGIHLSLSVLLCASPGIAAILVDWRAFLWAQRKRRRKALASQAPA